MPSAKVLEQKQKVVADLAERIKSSAAGVLVNYQGITVADDTALRAELRKAGVNYTVIKNTLISKACDIVGFEGLKDVLSGMTAIATSEEDAVAPARIINDFAKKNENYSIKAGFVEGELLDVKGVEELAAIAIGYKRIIEEAAGELKDLGEIINPTDMSLTDKDRIDVVERVYGTLMRHRRLAGYFTRRCISVSLLRARTHRDMERVVALYGTDEQRYW